MRRAVVLFLLAVLVACEACGSNDSNEPIGQTRSALFANDKAAFQYFVGKGLTNFQAAGIVGNLDQESGVDPNAVQQNGPGRGIAQWSAGGRWDTDANDNAVAFAKKQGQSVWSLQLQLDFIWYELTTFSGYGLAALKKTTNVSDATVVFQNDFEGCGQCIQTQRINYAKAVLAAYGTIDYAAQFVSQSFPPASMTLQMEEGQVIPSSITLKNTGAKAWDSNTRIGTTQPRDRASVFADSTWIAPNRPAAVKGSVAPGATYKFDFDLRAPNKPGTYDEFFGVVEEGVTWFADPPEDQLEVKIVVVPKSDSGVPVHPDAGTTSTDAGSDDAAPIGDSETSFPQPGGCNTSGGSGSWTAMVFAMLAVLRRKGSR